jgi:DNA-binding transcriptional LysR family regulator
MRLLYSRHLEHFLAVYEAGSLRQAAESSGVTQPALTKSLRVLEGALSVTLFERRASGVVPTQAATILRRHAQHIVNNSRHVALELALLKGGRTGTLRVGSGIIWSVSRMPALLARLHAQFPQLEIVLQTGIADQLTPRLVNGELDIVFASVPRQPLPAGFVTAALPQADMTVFGRRAHPLARRRSVRLRDLAGYDFVGFADDVDFQRHAENAFGAAGMSVPRTILRSSSLDALIATVAASDSLVILADLLSGRVLDAGLSRLRLSEPLWRISMGIMYHEHSAELTPLRTMLDLSAR